jgi:hypothetical protein
MTLVKDLWWVAWQDCPRTPILGFRITDALLPANLGIGSGASRGGASRGLPANNVVLF